MKKAILFIIFAAIVAVLLTSCSHTKYIKNHKDEVCDTYCPDKIIEITTEKEIVKFDTIYETIIVEVNLPSDTIIIYKYVTYDGSTGFVHMDTIYATNGLAKAKAWVFKSELGLQVYNSPTYMVKIDSLKRIIEKHEKYISSDKQTTTNIVKTENPWWLWYLVVIAFLLGVFGKSILKFLTNKLRS